MKRTSPAAWAGRSCRRGHAPICGGGYLTTHIPRFAIRYDVPRAAPNPPPVWPLLVGVSLGAALTWAVRRFWAPPVAKAQPTKLRFKQRPLDLTGLLRIKPTPEPVVLQAPVAPLPVPARAAPKKKATPHPKAPLSLAEKIIQESVRSTPARTSPASRSRRPTRVLQTGISVEGGRLTIKDWSAWMAFAPKAMDRAIDVGATTPEDVLIHLFETAFPSYAWPPKETSLMAPQWDRLVPVLAESLRMEPPPKGAHLRVIK